MQLGLAWKGSSRRKEAVGSVTSYRRSHPSSFPEEREVGREPRVPGDNGSCDEELELQSLSGRSCPLVFYPKILAPS